jgi:hypothetical protein
MSTVCPGSRPKSSQAVYDRTPLSSASSPSKMTCCSPPYWIDRLPTERTTAVVETLLSPVVTSASGFVGTSLSPPPFPYLFRRVCLASSIGTLYSCMFSRSALTSVLSTPRSEASSSAWSSRLIHPLRHRATKEFSPPVSSDEPVPGTYCGETNSVDVDSGRLYGSALGMVLETPAPVVPTDVTASGNVDAAVGAALLVGTLLVPLATYLDLRTLETVAWEPATARWLLAALVPVVILAAGAVYCIRRAAAVRGDVPGAYWETAAVGGVGVWIAAFAIEIATDHVAIPLVDRYLFGPLLFAGLLGVPVAVSPRRRARPGVH